MFSFKDNQFMQKESLKKQLQVLIDEVNSKDDNELDIILFRKISAIAWCMNLLGFFSEVERKNVLESIKGYNKFANILFINSENSDKELINNNSILLKKYFELYKYYQNVDGNRFKTYVDYKRMEKATYEFLEMMGCIELFEEMKRKNMIIRHKNILIGDAWSIDNYGLSYILLSDIYKGDSRYYTDLIHEMGHAYSNYVLRNSKDWKYQYPAYAEVISIMFERIFYQFIYDNSFVSDGDLRNMIAHFEAGKCNRLCIGICTSQIIESNKYSITDDGYIIPTQDWIDNCKSKSIFSKVDDINYYAPWISMLCYPYIIGNMASIKLAMDYKRNNKDFISKLQETIIDVSTIPTNELIEKYCSVSDFEPFFLNNFYDYKVKKK